jgi:hypothetical protein
MMSDQRKQRYSSISTDNVWAWDLAISKAVAIEIYCGPRNPASKTPVKSQNAIIE